MEFVAKWRASQFYGLSVYPADFAAMYEHQEGLCAICKKPPSNRGFVADHDHNTFQVRGLLCYRCNHLVGLYETGHPSKDRHVVIQIEHYLKNYYGACYSTIVSMKDGREQLRIRNPRTLTGEEWENIQHEEPTCEECQHPLGSHQGSICLSCLKFKLPTACAPTLSKSPVKPRHRGPSAPRLSELKLRFSCESCELVPCISVRSTCTRLSYNLPRNGMDPRLYEVTASPKVEKPEEGCPG